MQKTSLFSFDLVIVGGGPVGLLLSLFLRQSGLSVAVVDGAPLKTASQKGRSFALSFASVAALKVEGLWEQVKKGSTPVKKIYVTKEGAAQHFLFEPESVGAEALGFMVQESSLFEALSQHVLSKKAGVHYHKGRFKSHVPCALGTKVLLEDGLSLDAKLLVGADGARSFTRQKMGVPTLRYAYAQTAVVFTVKHTKPHHFCAFEHFTSKGPLAFLPLEKNHSAVVWSLDKEVAEKFLAHPLALLNALIHHFGWGLGDLELASEIGTYPLALTMPKKCYGTRWVLVGDAAHAIHPVAGQGLNLGIRDVFLLGRHLAHLKALGLDIGSTTALKTYASSRLPDQWSMALATHVFGSGMTTKLSHLFWPCSAKMLPFFKKRVVRHAMGIGIDPLLDALCNSDRKTSALKR